MSALAYFKDVDAREDRRSSVRHVLKLTTAASMAPGTDAGALIHDISAEGFLVQTTADLSTGTQFTVELPEADETVATVIWKRGEYFGCEFAEPLRKAVLSAVMLKNPSLAPQPPAFEEHGRTANKASSGAELRSRTKLWIIIALSASAWFLVAILLLIWAQGGM